MHNESRNVHNRVVLLFGLLLLAISGCTNAKAEKEAADQLKAIGAIISPNSDGKPNSLILGVPGKEVNLDEALPLATKLSTVKSIMLSDSNVTDEQLAQVAKLRNLNDLQLNATPITDAGIKQIAGLSKLESLMVTDTKITGACVEDLARLSALQVLQVSGTQIANLAPLAKLQKLTLLVIDNVAISDDDAAAIGEIPNLLRLQMIGSTISPTALKQLQKNVDSVVTE